MKLAVDDAGAGYSSFQHILQLRPDIIKLDMGLTRSINTHPGRRALVSAMIHFARETRAQIVAEGIETEMELATLRSLGIAKGQGYLLGRPVDLAGAKSLVAAATSRRKAADFGRIGEAVRPLPQGRAETRRSNGGSVAAG